MTMILDALVGELVSQLLSEIMDKKDKAMKFSSTLESLATTLKSIEPTVKEIDGFNKRLDKSAKEMQGVVDQMKKGKRLVDECSKVQWWNCCCKANYQEELEGVHQNIRSFFGLEMQGQIARNGLETLILAKEIHEKIKTLDPKKEKNESIKACTPPQPPAFIVGLDAPLRELKLRLLREQVSFSVLTVTGMGGAGKSTLAKKLCWDEEVKGKFKENIFFLPFAKTPKLSTLVSRLFKHKEFEVPEFQSDEDVVNQLENLLNKIGESPILLVLDDVWPETVYLVGKFVFQIPNYMILVTSRFAIEIFDRPYVLKPLGNADAMELFRHEASLNRSNYRIPADVVQEKSFDTLDHEIAECFRDLGLFPEAQRIPAAALVDMWALRDEDDINAMEKIYQLVNRNMADIFVKRNVESGTVDCNYHNVTQRGTVDYNYHYVTQHGLLRELAILQTRQVPVQNRRRLIIDNTVPAWRSVLNEDHIAARILSISTDEDFDSEWCNLQPTEVEVLVLSLRKKKFKLPMFMKNMNKLKVLIITNYDFSLADIENFELLDYLSDLKRIRLEKVSIPFLSKTRVQLKNLRKFSFLMCNVNAAFKNRSVEISYVLPNLEEINIDYCDIVELPAAISNIVSLKKLSITSYHMLSALPGGIGDLVNLETLRLTSCTNLVELPGSVTSLHKLQFLDISDCVSLNKLPDNMGELQSLTEINCTGCSRVAELPCSIMELGGLKIVICDENMAVLWEQYRIILSDLQLEVAEVDFNLNWL